jgi:hypothetical protein
MSYPSLVLDDLGKAQTVTCVLGVIATMQLYFTAEEQLEILIRRPNTLSIKAVERVHVCAQ